MPFNASKRPKLTEAQTKALSKINSVRQYASSSGNLSFGNNFNKYRSLVSLNKNTNLPPEKQISTFELCLNVIDAIKPGASDLITQQFLSKIFAVTGPDSTVLEEIIINSLAKALDKNKKNLAPPTPEEEQGNSEGQPPSSETESQDEASQDSQESNFQQFEWLEYQVILKSQDGDNYEIEIINNSNGKVPFFEILVDISDGGIVTQNIDSSPFEQIKGYYLRKLSPGNPQVGGLNESFIYQSVTYPPAGRNIADIDNSVGTLKGVVFATDNNETIPQAKIEVLGSEPKVELLTDINGEFKIENLNFGTKTLKVSYDFDSFKEKEIEIYVNAETTTEIQIPLEPQDVTVVGEEDVDFSDTTLDNNQSQSEEGVEDFKVQYSFELSKPLVQYQFEKDIDENNNLVKLKVKTRYTDVTTNNTEVIDSSEFPNFEIIIDSLVDEDDLEIDEVLEQDNIPIPDILDLEFEADDLAENIRENGYSLLRENGSTLIYPQQNTSNLEITIKNNINLPEYNKEIPIINAGFSFVNDFFNSEVSKDREVNETSYPAQGTKGELVETPLPSGGVLEIFVPLENIEDNVQGEPTDVGSTNGSSSFSETPTEAPEPSSVSFNGFREEDIGLTNKQYLEKYLLPALTLGKRALVAKIISMIFGPKENMDNNPELQNILLDSAACGEKMFSVYSNPDVTEAELEYNRIRLKEQLEKGKIELNVSCQKVEISLPENYLEEFDLEDSETIGISEQNRPNPALSFVALGNYVDNEVQRQRNDEDASSVKKTFLQIIIDKIIQYVGIAFVTNPQMTEVMKFINFELSKSGQAPLSAKDLCSSPCEIVNACNSGNQEEFEKKSAFNDILSNSLLALVLSLLVPKIINECKLIIRGYLTEKAKEKIQKLRLRQQKRFEQFNDLTGNLDKATQYKRTFENSGIPELLNYIKNLT